MKLSKQLTFQEIQDWFGNRGIRVTRRHFKKIGNDEKYIYWIPNNKLCISNDNDYLASEYASSKTVLYAPIFSLWCEIEDEVYQKDCKFKFQI